MDIKERFLRKITERILPLFKKLNIPSEILTLFRIIFAIYVSIILLLGNRILSIISLTIYQFIFLLDYIDGKLARYQRRFSLRWVKIDILSHYIISSFFILSISLSYFIKTKNFILLYSGLFCFLLILSSFFIELINFKKIRLNNKQNKNNRTSFPFYSFFGIDNPFNIFYFLVLLNLISFLIIFYTILYILLLLIKIKRITFISNYK
ncbi:MAG: CDP-alcohol phosphatidyltransferase family protein [Candidatus Pacearchaeota archaeon]